MGEYFKIREKDIYVEIMGDAEKEPLLFIHGGPGGIGCADFSKYQGERLAKDFRVIAPDQRGVWRSEAIKDDEEISLEDMIEDFEELRKKLNINKWSILSHSFGGYLSVLYAEKYKDSIKCIIYENPSFNFARSERSLLRAGAYELIRNGKRQIGELYLKLLSKTHNYKEINAILLKEMQELGSNAENSLWHNKEYKSILKNIVMSTQDGRELWTKSTKTRKKVLSDWRVYSDVFAELPENFVIDKPSLLLKGKYDPITTSTQIAELKERSLQNEVEIFNNSSHYIRIEEPEKYCNVIKEFMDKYKIYEA